MIVTISPNKCPPMRWFTYINSCPSMHWPQDYNKTFLYWATDARRKGRGGNKLCWTLDNVKTFYTMKPQNYKWQNRKLRCIYRHHLKVALPRCNKECFSRQNCAADGRLCRSRVAAKNFVFLISRNFQEIFNFVFCQILLKFCEILRDSK